MKNKRVEEIAVVEKLPGNKVIISGSADAVTREEEKYFSFGWMIVPGSGEVRRQNDGREYLYFVTLYQPSDYRKRIKERNRHAAITFG